jgi:hypothetical protein
MKLESICPTCGCTRLTSSHNKPRPRCRRCTYSFRDQTGVKNPFFGKQHSDASKAAIGQYQRSDAQKEQARTSLLIQGNTRAPYEVWVQKYGQQVADAKMVILASKKSVNATGSNNPMYGKPAPINSGGGWSGWYQGHYFRSILELSYLKQLLDNRIQFANGECARYAIAYQLGSVDRTYFCDFVLTDLGQFVEIKPQKLVATDVNAAKFAAARNKHGNSFIVLTEADVHVLDKEELAAMYQSLDLKWTSKWEKRYHANFGLRVAG